MGHMHLGVAMYTWGFICTLGVQLHLEGFKCTLGGGVKSVIYTWVGSYSLGCPYALGVFQMHLGWCGAGCHIHLRDGHIHLVVDIHIGGFKCSWMVSNVLGVVGCLV